MAGIFGQQTAPTIKVNTMPAEIIDESRSRQDALIAQSKKKGKSSQYVAKDYFVNNTNSQVAGQAVATKKLLGE